MEYLPNESVVAPLPDVVSTLTDSSGMERDASYTVPLILACDIAVEKNTNNMHVAKTLMELVR